MDFEKYVKWFENRLINTFNTIFPNKKAIIFLDQCPFHMVCNGMPSSTEPKEKVIDYYKNYNISSIQVQRFKENGDLGPILEFETDHFGKKPSKVNPNLGGPSKDEMYLYLFLYLKKKNPEALEPVISQIARKYGHKVLFACPYNPNDMPFEFLNSYVKLMVKQCCRKHRTILELKNDIRSRFYGGITLSKRQHNKVNQNMCSGWFDKAEQNMNEEIKKMLNVENTNISNMWKENCEYNLFSPFTRIPKTTKTLKKLSKQFVIVIDGEQQKFIDL